MTYRVRKLERKLKSLDQSIPDYQLQKNRLEKDLQLIKGELPISSVSNGLVPITGAQSRPARGSAKSGRMSAQGRNRRKRSRNNNSKTSKAIIPKTSIAPNLLTKDPISTIGNIRSFCKQCLKYIQQADRMMETLFVSANSLNESGVLNKLIKDKGKNLSTGDLTNILMALMNSPVGGDFLKRMGSNNSEEPPAQS
jgi:hypothetical protein